MTKEEKKNTGKLTYHQGQCSCGHLIFEAYDFSAPTKEGCVGFDWCGFCRTKTMIYKKDD